MSLKVTGEAQICEVLEATMEECAPPCKSLVDAYEACVVRVGPEPARFVDCQVQYIDYYRCLDKCVPQALFKKLK